MDVPIEALISLLTNMWFAVSGLIGAFIAIMAFVWKQSKKATILNINIQDIKKKCLKIDELEHRLTVIETRFEPFLAILEESISHMLPKNPLNPKTIQKIKDGTATLLDINECDKIVKDEITKKKDDPVKLIMIRYWLALKRNELNKK